jgi:hypothetical protein
VITARTDVVIDVKDIAAFAISEAIGIAASRISTMRIAFSFLRRVRS